MEQLDDWNQGVEGLRGAGQAEDQEDYDDRENMRRLVEVVTEFGWPGRSLVGRDASQAAEVMLQHAETGAAEATGSFLEGSGSFLEASAQPLAMAEDQIRVEEGRKQVYGTEVTQGPDGVPRLYPHENPESVDERADKSAFQRSMSTFARLNR